MYFCLKDLLYKYVIISRYIWVLFCSCFFVYIYHNIISQRLATGKLIDLLNPYLDLYNGNAAHMMAYLNQTNKSDPKVLATYQECIELQQQLHNCTNLLKRLQNIPDCNEKVLDAIDKGLVTSESLLERASTDKLRVITENIIDLLLYFYFQKGDVVSWDILVFLMRIARYWNSLFAFLFPLSYNLGVFKKRVDRLILR